MGGQWVAPPCQPQSLPAPILASGIDSPTVGASMEWIMDVYCMGSRERSVGGA